MQIHNVKRHATTHEKCQKASGIQETLQDNESSNSAGCKTATEDQAQKENCETIYRTEVTVQDVEISTGLPQHMLNLILQEGTMIPDEVIQHAIIIMRNHSPQLARYIGQTTPAEMEVALRGRLHN